MSAEGGTAWLPKALGWLVVLVVGGALGAGMLFLVGLAKSPRPLEQLWPQVGIEVRNGDSVAWPLGPLLFPPGARLRIYRDGADNDLDWWGVEDRQGRPLSPPPGAQAEQTAYGRYRLSGLDGPWRGFLQAPAGDGGCSWAPLDAFRSAPPGLVVKVYSDDRVRFAATHRYSRRPGGGILLRLHNRYGSLAPSGSAASGDDRFRCRADAGEGRLGALGRLLGAVWEGVGPTK